MKNSKQKTNGTRNTNYKDQSARESIYAQQWHTATKHPAVLDAGIEDAVSCTVRPMSNTFTSSMV